MNPWISNPQTWISGVIKNRVFLRVLTESGVDSLLHLNKRPSRGEWERDFIPGAQRPALVRWYVVWAHFHISPDQPVRVAPGCAERTGWSGGMWEAHEPRRALLLGRSLLIPDAVTLGVEF